MACLASIPLKTISFVLFLSLVITPSTSTRTLTDQLEPPAAAPEPEEPVPDGDGPHPLTFFMHDVLGGSNPTARAVTGVVTNPSINAQVAFAKPNGANIPLNNGLPQNNNNAGFLNNNNLPFLTGLSGNPGDVYQCLLFLLLIFSVELPTL